MSSPSFTLPEKPHIHPFPGMALLEYYAGQAMIAIISSDISGRLTADKIAELSFEQAAAMERMAERMRK
ncbi:MAG TPA: hypothetical protein VK181_11875 [Rhizobium sp.]|nr:hypothetical protein [Rhizobium sp.]